LKVDEKKLEESEKKLKDDIDAFEALKAELETDKKIVDRIKLEYDMEKTNLDNQRLKLDDEAKSIADEHKHIEEEKQTLAQEKTDIDNELQRLVEQKLEVQQIKQLCEDKETEMIIKLKERDAKIEELSHLYADERSKRERLESKVSSVTKSPEPKDSSTFSYFKSRMADIKSKDHDNTLTLSDSSIISENLTDEERKQKLYNDYQVLLTDINNAIFQKREQINEMEKNPGGGYFKTRNLNSTKTHVTKLEDLQGRAKKAFRVLDSKATCTLVEEVSEHVILKGFRNEMM